MQLLKFQKLKHLSILIKVNSLKKSSVKSDIKIVIHDQRTGTNPIKLFSIKTQLGGASTLLNAGKTNNFIYEIENINLSDEQIIFKFELIQT